MTERDTERGEDSDGLKYRREMDYIKIQAGVDAMSEPQEKSVETAC